jgi:hypothetical protein
LLRKYFAERLPVHAANLAADTACVLNSEMNFPKNGISATSFAPETRQLQLAEKQTSQEIRYS